MITIFYHKFSTPFSIKKWTLYFQQMPENIQERIKRYRKEENKYQLLIGRLLLHQGMHRLGYKDFRLDSLSYNEYNYPSWRNDIPFNIAHSGNVVACAFAQNKTLIGLDIEKERLINLQDFDYILNNLDRQAIEKAENPYTSFLKIWTIKEAVTKAIGKGLSIDVQQIFIYNQYAVYDNKKWYFQSLPLAQNYMGHFVTNKATLPLIKFEEISF